jgi:hypothetical protein
VLDKDLSDFAQRDNAMAWVQQRVNAYRAMHIGLNVDAIVPDLLRLTRSWAPQETSRLAICLVADWFGIANCQGGAQDLAWYDGLSPYSTTPLPVDEYMYIARCFNVWWSTLTRSGELLPFLMPQFDADTVHPWSYKVPGTSITQMFYVIIPWTASRRRASVAKSAMARLFGMWREDIITHNHDPLVIYNRIQVWSRQGQQVHIGRG